MKRGKVGTALKGNTWGGSRVTTRVLCRKGQVDCELSVRGERVFWKTGQKIK